MNVFTRPARMHVHSNTTGLNVKDVIQDKFTNCIQAVMSEARQSGKPVEAKETSDLCNNVSNSFRQEV